MTTATLQRLSAHRSAGHATQRGTALVVALIMLMILTMLGIAAMGTTTLEEKMASNMQEGTRAFQAAESGLAKAASTTGTLDLNATTTNSFSIDSGKGGSAEVKTTFLQYSKPKRGTGNSTNWQVANFDQISTGSSGTGRSVVHQGIGQMVPGQNN
jgi:Tfp pilus assembly protein PilX